eukprot:6178574-Pleurochrysis_carterae.AAC.1
MACGSFGPNRIEQPLGWPKGRLQQEAKRIPKLSCLSACFELNCKGAAQGAATLGGATIKLVAQLPSYWCYYPVAYRALDVGAEATRLLQHAATLEPQ